MFCYHMWPKKYKLVAVWYCSSWRQKCGKRATKLCVEKNLFMKYLVCMVYDVEHFVYSIVSRLFEKIGTFVLSCLEIS